MPQNGTTPDFTALRLRRLVEKNKNAPESTPMAEGLDDFPPNRTVKVIKLLGEEKFRPEPKPRENLEFRRLCERQIIRQHEAGFIPKEASSLASRRL